MELQKPIDRPGMVLNFPLVVVAYLALVRVCARAENSTKPRAAYQDFSQLWKDADPTTWSYVASGIEVQFGKFEFLLKFQFVPTFTFFGMLTQFSLP